MDPERVNADLKFHCDLHRPDVLCSTNLSLKLHYTKQSPSGY